MPGSETQFSFSCRMTCRCFAKKNVTNCTSHEWLSATTSNVSLTSLKLTGLWSFLCWLLLLVMVAILKVIKLSGLLFLIRFDKQIPEVSMGFGFGFRSSGFCEKSFRRISAQGDPFPAPPSLLHLV